MKTYVIILNPLALSPYSLYMLPGDLHKKVPLGSETTFPFIHSLYESVLSANRYHISV